MKTIISALHFIWNDMGECLEKATQEFGLDGVELSWHESFARPHCTAEDLDALAALRGSHAAALSAHIWDNLADSPPSSACDNLLNWLRLCEKTGTRNLVVHGGSYPDRKEGIRKTRRILESILPEFEKAKVIMNIENHYAYEYHGCRELFSQPWEFKELFGLASPSLQFCFDTGHGNMTGNTDELIGELAPWLKYIHLADNHGVDDDHVPYRKGTVAWDAIFAHLRRVSFDGIFCVEFPVFEDRAPFDACVAEIRKRWIKGLSGC